MKIVSDVLSEQQVAHVIDMMAVSDGWFGKHLFVYVDGCDDCWMIKVAFDDFMLNFYSISTVDGADVALVDLIAYLGSLFHMVYTLDRHYDYKIKKLIGD